MSAQRRGIGAAVLLAAACAARAATPVLGDVALRAYAERPWDKAALMGSTVRLGTHHGVPVVAEYPCADVCPQYTVRIIHYELPPGLGCADAGGVERSVGVPVAIAVLPKTFCFPRVLVEADLHYAR
ncbi:hypothetical protein [Frateuria defendens]|uniref:hypothetical protein n=1 Tax=Frateuria defendens TaxID=2219559 RepID=UPI00066FFD56|nr:hypothetical protein [Frateuria defendens]